MSVHKFFFLFVYLFVLNLVVNCQNYNFYRGNLHAHSQYSDGNAANSLFYDTPYDCFLFADSSQQFDFLGISEHNHAGAGMALNNYVNGINQALMATNSNFVALYGMEWGTISGGGHVIIYGVDSLMGWETNNYSVLTTYGDYNNLFQMIKNRSNSFCYLAHPETTDYNALFSSSYSQTNDDAIIGLAVRSGPAFSTNVTYSNPSTFSYYQRYKDLLALGYHVGPLIDHDNHYITFGRHTPARTVILAPSLTRENIFDAMKKMRYYASEDWNTNVNYTINNSNYMGQIVTSNQNPTFQISINDPDIGDNVSYIRIRYALQNGGNTAPAILASSTTNTLNYTHNINANDAYYYFLEIQQADGNMIYSSPIWYTKASILPVELISFDADYDNNKDIIEVKWTTESEINADYFLLESSLDGENWMLKSKLKTTGNKNFINQYNYLDSNSFLGLNYYRLSEFDLDGKLNFQKTISANRKMLNHFDVFPNPSYTEIYIDANNHLFNSTYSVVNTLGQKIEEGTINEKITKIDVSSWKKGIYYIIIKKDQRVEQMSFIVE